MSGLKIMVNRLIDQAVNAMKYEQAFYQRRWRSGPKNRCRFQLDSGGLYKCLQSQRHCFTCQHVMTSSCKVRRYHCDIWVQEMFWNWTWLFLLSGCDYLLQTRSVLVFFSLNYAALMRKKDIRKLMQDATAWKCVIWFELSFFIFPPLQNNIALVIQ